MSDPHRRNVGIAAAALLASTSTLVCCVLPVVFVAAGAGAALVSLVAAFPQLVWLSEHKGLVFALAGAALAASGLLLWRARRLPCPTEARAAEQCARLRRASMRLYVAAFAAYGVGAAFAFLLPWWSALGAAGSSAR